MTKSHWSKKQVAAYNAAVKRGDVIAYCNTYDFGHGPIDALRFVAKRSLTTSERGNRG